MIIWIYAISHFLPALSASRAPPVDSGCSGRACNPRMGNLALGRLITTHSVCGSNSSEPYCAFKPPLFPRSGKGFCASPKCGKCSAASPGDAHLASAMSDSSFRAPHTWWQSAEGAREETVRLDFETEFLFTHLILVFRSPRPAAMTLQRSQDHGQTWTTLKCFARNCEEAFGLAEGKSSPGNGTTCSSKYSGAFPCTRGEVIYRALSPGSALDPYGPDAQEQLMVTNLRVQLLQRQPCPCEAKHSGDLPTKHYAIYDFIVKGSCLCNGHADHCVPVSGHQRKTHNMVHGKCVCRHNTAGDHCQLCAPLYNNRPWQAANGISGSPHECQKCKCNGHAQSCHLDRRLWLLSGRRGGGVCDNCLHNTAGPNCQICKRGHYRDPTLPKTSPNSCQPCLCHPLGSVSAGGPLCNPSSRGCTCKPGVASPHCDRCMMGYWGLGQYGCRPCDCTGECDPYSGDCLSGSEVGVPFAATDHSGRSEMALFRPEELFSALHHSEKCECVEATLSNPKLFCAAEYDYVLMAKVKAADDKGSHAEVEVTVKKVLYSKQRLKILRGTLTLHPESWTIQGCTCPILNPGSDYLVAGHEDLRTGHLIINMKSFVKPWKTSLGQKIIDVIRKDCAKKTVIQKLQFTEIVK
ncbi:netrin-4-like [Eucyclogobius newberryi]|uniref:netrin-4-like n=1 Tax=Eucyclogobius newberryi TaxID=166745 RepID=UPI003B5C0C07